MILADMCSTSYSIRIFLIVKIVIQTIFTIIPIIIMIRAFFALFKNVVDKQPTLGKDLGNVFKSLIAGLIVFLIPTMISYIFTDLIDMTHVDFIGCYESASLEKYKAAEEAERAAQEEDKRQKEAEAQKINEDMQGKRKKETEEAAKKRKEQEDKYPRKKEDNSGGANGSTTSSVGKGGTNIIIGDSRTVGMCATLTGDWSGCQFSNGGSKTNGSDIYIAQGSMSYSWFNSTAVPAVNAIINANPGTKYNIFSLMGVNMLLYDIDKYIPEYNSLATGSWKNHNIILVSVTPVNESVEAQHGYSTKNADIVTFNTKLKSGTTSNRNVAYCDVYNQILGYFGTGDGLHYDANTYKDIYDKMMKCA